LKEDKMKNLKHASQIMIMVFLLLISAISLSSGQTITGKIDGVVTDNEGVPLPGVTVTATSPAAMGAPTSITSDKGTFRFTNLPPGIYKLVFILDGFQTIERENVQVMINATVSLSVSMKFKTLEETVEVIAETPVLDVKKSGMSTNFAQEEMENIPAGRHSFADIVKQVPGMLSQGEGGALRFTLMVWIKAVRSWGFPGPIPIKIFLRRWKLRG
jgi:hypothetical protein